MRRRLRILAAAVLLTPVVALLWFSTTESGLQWGYQQAKPYLPGELSMTRVEGRLIGPITVTDLEYHQSGVSIKADRIVVEWLPSALLAANIDITQLHVQSLKIALPQAEKTAQPLRLPEIHLPWRVALRDVKVDDLHVNQNSQTFAVNRIQLNATSLFSRIDIDEFTLEADRFNLAINGKLRPTGRYRHELAIRWQTELPTREMIEGRGELAGDMTTTRITQHLSGPLALTLDAEATNLLEQFSWQARIDVTAFDTSKLNPDWPALSGRLNVAGGGDLTTATLSGRLDGSSSDLGPLKTDFSLRRLSDNTLQIDRLMLYTPTTDTRLHARGQWRPGADGGDVAVALQWQNLRWPLKDDAWFDSAIGSGWLEGNLKHYRAGLATDRPWPQAPPSFWYVSAEGDLNGLDFHSLRVTALHGEATAEGRLDWSPQLAWHARAGVTAIDPAALWPQWPGRLDATLTSSGRYEDGQLSADADITQLTGTLRGYPVSLQSRLGWRGNGALDIKRFEFRSATSQVSARGRLGETIKLEWSIAAPNLAELYPQAQGQLHAEGLLTGLPAAPVIQATFKGEALSLPEYAIGAVDGSVSVDLFRWRKLDIDVTAEALDLKGHALQSLTLHADTHHLEAKAVSEEATAHVELRSEVDEKGWRGRIERADIESLRFNNWRLKTPATLTIGEKSMVADPFCWRNQETATVCASFRREDEVWRSRLEMNRLPLLLFEPWLPPDLKLEGVADASAELQFHSPNQLLGQARIQLPPGAVNYPLLEGERDRWEYRDGRVEIELNGEGLTATSGITMNNGDRFHGRFALPGARLLALNERQQPLHASAELHISDLGLIEALIPEVQDLQGEIALNLSASGTLAQPLISGQAQLLNGALRIPRLGLAVEQFNVKSRSDRLDRLHFHLDARSGDGTLAVQGVTTLDSRAGWPTEISINGDNFEVSRIPEAQVTVSPDLQIKLQRRTIDIKGKVHIPYARLQPKDITTAARVSNDAVIVGSEQVPEERWAIFTRIRLTLGERVNFYGFGFEGRLGGNLLLNDEPGQLTTATGEITIPEGRYRAYGQRLDVEHGRLLYTGGPLTNPGVDLRAVRHVGNVTAGLKVRGSLNQPQVELFSIPAMGQTDALAYLLLGRPVENTSGEEGAMMAKAALALGLSGGDRLARTLGDRFGLDEMRIESSDTGEQASLVMGRYLSPRVYVSYGVGLIEAFNTFSVRYRISDKWTLKGESGEHQGADFLYTIER